MSNKITVKIERPRHTVKVARPKHTVKLERTLVKTTANSVIDESFTPTNGQTEFVLSNIPKSNSEVFVFVNNATYIVGNDFTIDGATITWLEAFDIMADDVFTVRYPI